jgi:acyl-CoA synthetase (AMP-forming)/AMP-acid ligase II
LLGEVPVAQVVLVPGTTTTIDELLEHCRKLLAKIKVPVRLEIVSDFVRNPVGKIDKPRMRREAAPVDVPVTTTVTVPGA